MGPLSSLKQRLAGAPATADTQTGFPSALGDTFLQYARRHGPSDQDNSFPARVADHELDAVDHDTSVLAFPISHYYISSSHNTYLAGNQLYGRASIVPYQYTLENACRCVEIDVWDGVDIQGAAKPITPKPTPKEAALAHVGKDIEALRIAAHHPHVPNSGKETVIDKIEKWHVDRVEPRVLHGHTATKEVSFRDVCRAIRDSAFKTCDLPIIASLEIHTNHEQQGIMVDIMRSEWTDHLLENDPGFDTTQTLPPLETLRNKILIKVKYSPPVTATKKEPTDGNETDTSSSSDSSIEQDHAPKAKIIEPLSSMGVYTRSYHFHSFEQPEASSPGHIFALSEAKAHDQLTDCPTAMTRHNQHYLMRVYPKGVRITSSNLDPLPLWRAGVQLVALNWQYVNRATMLNHALFDRTAGWVLKPSYLRPSAARDPGCESDPLNVFGTLSLRLTVLAARGAFKKGRPYLKTELHLDRAQDLSMRLKTVDSTQSSHSAGATKFTAKTEHHGHIVDAETHAHTAAAGHGNVTIDFKAQVLEFKKIPCTRQALSFMRVKIKNDDWKKDQLVAWACVRWTRLREGLRTLRLYDAEGAECGVLLCVVEKGFVADP